MLALSVRTVRTHTRMLALLLAGLNFPVARFASQISLAAAAVACADNSFARLDATSS